MEYSGGRGGTFMAMNDLQYQAEERMNIIPYFCV